MANLPAEETASLSDEAACKALISGFMRKVGILRYMTDDFPFVVDGFTEYREMELAGTKVKVRLSYYGYNYVIFGCRGASFGCKVDDDIDYCRTIAEECGLEITHSVKPAR